VSSLPTTALAAGFGYVLKLKLIGFSLVFWQHFEKKKPNMTKFVNTKNCVARDSYTD